MKCNSAISDDELKTFGPEWLILELIAKGNCDVKIKKILDLNCIHWGELIEQAMNHKMFPMLCHQFLKEDFFCYVPPFINQYFKQITDLNAIKNKIIKQEVLTISELLQRDNVSFVATKGVVLDYELYDGNGSRFLSDGDFIADFAFEKNIVKILEKSGYYAGSVDWRKNCARKLTREEFLLYGNTKDKLPEYLKPINNPITTYVSLGFSGSLTWAGCEYNVDVKEVLNNVVLQKLDADFEQKAPVLDVPYHFIYIMLHLYKHAWIKHLSKWKNDVNLVKFGDVYRYWSKYKEILRKELPSIVAKYNLERVVAWVLYHTGEIFKEDILKYLNISPVVDENYYNSAGDSFGGIRFWSGTMRERLYSKNRETLFKEG